MPRMFERPSAASADLGALSRRGPFRTLRRNASSRSALSIAPVRGDVDHVVETVSDHVRFAAVGVATGSPLATRSESRRTPTGNNHAPLQRENTSFLRFLGRALQMRIRCPSRSRVTSQTNIVRRDGYIQRCPKCLALIPQGRRSFALPLKQFEVVSTNRSNDSHL